MNLEHYYLSLRIYLQVDISFPLNELKDSGGSSDQSRRYCLFPSRAHKDQVHFFTQGLLDVLTATVKASGVSGGLSSAF